jgi:cytochrome c-type biogenesis protein CcmH
MTSKHQSLQEQLQQLQALHASGTLGDEAYAAARRAVEQTQGVAAGGLAQRPSWQLQAGLLVGVLALAVAGYSYTGAPDAVVVGPVQAAVPAVAEGEAPVTAEQVNEIVERLAQRLQNKPDDATGWALLARAYSSLARHPEAVPAYEKALTLGGDDASLLADYADALAAMNGGQFSDAALSVVQRALALEPNNIKALALAGSAAFDRRDYITAVKHWEVVESGLPPDSGILPQVRDSIAQARQLGGLPPSGPAGAPVAAAPAAALPPPTATATAGAVAGAVQGRISLAPALAARVSPEDTVFILARPAEGPRMPLAVLRKQVKDLPLDFKLDDSMAMAPGATISAHARIVVSARVSKSGDAMPKPGDLSGQSAVVAPGATGLVVQISDVVGGP